MPADLIGTNVVLQTSDGRPALRVSKRPDLRQHRAGRRNQSRHAQDAIGAPRGDAGAPCHRGRATRIRCRRLSSSWPRKIRSRWRGLIRCPRRSSIASSSSSSSSFRRLDDLETILDRTTETTRPKAEPIFRRRSASCAWASWCARFPCAHEVRRYAIHVVMASHPEHALASPLARRYVRYGSSPRGRKQSCLPPSSGPSSTAVTMSRATTSAALRRWPCGIGLSSTSRDRLTESRPTR